MQQIKNPKVSIIVPVYNTEQYLTRCLQSLLQQTLEDLEIIIVNDGSRDNAQIIIDNFAQHYPSKIKAFRQENKGLGAARNFGLNYAHGEYIGFVDSDDWVDVTMYQKMYDIAHITNSEIIICDFCCVAESSKYSWTAQGYRGDKVSPKTVSDFVLSSLNPATACNKLFHRHMFNIIQFSNLWYEDVATIPILFTYAKKIYYLKLSLYNYFQHDMAITAQIDNVKNLDIIQAWSRCMEYTNKHYRDEIAYAVYLSIENFLQFRRKYQTDYLVFFFQNKNIFMHNKFIKQAIQNGNIANLFEKRLIPKVIHYCWFGQNQKSETIKICMASWEKYLPDYEIIEWNERNCDIEANRFTSMAYKKEKWAFVADYFRFKVLYDHGGIYLDTDMLLHKSLDSFLCYDAFFGIEDKFFVNACIIGALPRNTVMKRILEAYTDASFEDTKTSTVCNIITKILQSFYALEKTGKTQFLGNNIAVFAPDILTINVYNGACVAEHLYNASWWDWSDPSGSNYKFEVLKSYFENLSSASHSGLTVGKMPAEDMRSMLHVYGAKVLLKQIFKIKIYERSPAWCKYLCRILYKLYRKWI